MEVAPGEISFPFREPEPPLGCPKDVPDFQDESMVPHGRTPALGSLGKSAETTETLRDAVAEGLHSALSETRGRSSALQRLYTWFMGEVIPAAERLLFLSESEIGRHLNTQAERDDHPLHEADLLLHRASEALCRKNYAEAGGALTQCAERLAAVLSIASNKSTHIRKNDGNAEFKRRFDRDTVISEHRRGFDLVCEEEKTSWGTLQRRFADSRRVIHEDAARGVMSAYLSSVWQEAHASRRALWELEEVEERESSAAVSAAREEWERGVVKHTVEFANQRLSVARLVEHLRVRARDLEAENPDKAVLKALVQSPKPFGNSTRISFNMQNITTSSAPSPLLEWSAASVRAWLLSHNLRCFAFDFRNLSGAELFNLTLEELQGTLSTDPASVQKVWSLIVNLRAENESLCVKDGVKKELRSAIEENSALRVYSVLQGSPGLNVNVPFEDGEYALELAAFADAGGVVGVLVEAGAVPRGGSVRALAVRLCSAGKPSAARVFFSTITAIPDHDIATLLSTCLSNLEALGETDAGVSTGLIEVVHMLLKVCPYEKVREKVEGSEVLSRVI